MPSKEFRTNDLPQAAQNDRMDRHVLVTGATRGIGFEIARAFIASGARVTVLGRTPESARAAAEKLAAAGHVHADVTDAVALESAIAEAEKAIGGIDVLVNNAGGAETAPVAKTDVAKLRAMMELNAEPVLTATRVVLPGMIARKFGRIITIASTAGLKGYAYVSAYCAAKHAAVGLTRAIAIEVAGTGVTVNAVCPGYSDTDLIAHSLDELEKKTGRARDDLLKTFTRQNPLGRLIAPREVAHAVLWLAEDEAAAITGQTIAVAGGEI
jgi:NAD(P)-dependent dehydrogenase (short-subunit alcohol dehydrogenase family)